VEKHKVFGSEVVKNGVFQSIESYILAIQMEKLCSRSDALLDGVKLLDDVKEILQQELQTKGGSNGKEAQPSS
jgi:hypothetical protein